MTPARVKPYRGGPCGGGDVLCGAIRCPERLADYGNCGIRLGVDYRPAGRVDGIQEYEISRRVQQGRQAARRPLKFDDGTPERDLAVPPVMISFNDLPVAVRCRRCNRVSTIRAGSIPHEEIATM